MLFYCQDHEVLSNIGAIYICRQPLLVDEQQLYRVELLELE